MDKNLLPLIAVPSYPRLKKGAVRRWLSDAVGVPIRYVESLRRAGSQEIIILTEDLDRENIDSILGRVDGLLLLGGGDIDPESYGQSASAEILGANRERDQAELALLHGAIARQIPILGICRGHQLLNVALGGSLDQDISTRTDLIAHGQPGIDDGEVMHEVEIAAHTRLVAATKVARVMCSSHHHQVVTETGAGLVATAHSSDGIIEATEYSAPDAPWVVSVQWHPEDTTATDANQQAIFDTFVDQARLRRTT